MARPLYDVVSLGRQQWVRLKDEKPILTAVVLRGAHDVEVPLYEPSGVHYAPTPAPACFGGCAFALPGLDGYVRVYSPGAKGLVAEARCPGPAESTTFNPRHPTCCAWVSRPTPTGSVDNPLLVMGLRDGSVAFRRFAGRLFHTLPVQTASASGPAADALRFLPGGNTSDAIRNIVATWAVPTETGVSKLHLAVWTHSGQHAIVGVTYSEDLEAPVACDVAVLGGVACAWLSWDAEPGALLRRGDAGEVHVFRYATKAHEWVGEDVTPDDAPAADGAADPDA